MISFLVQHILPPGASPEDPEVRRRCGALSGGGGIFLNLLRCAVKGASAVLTGEVALAADAVHKRSDGHGRME